MSRISAGDPRLQDLLAYINDLRTRVKRLELAAETRTVTFAATAPEVSSTSYSAFAYTVFPRSGSTLAVDVAVGGALEVQAVVDGQVIATGSSSGTGTVTLQGFLPGGWEFGERRRVEVQARRPSGSGAVSVVVVGASHR